MAVITSEILCYAPLNLPANDVDTLGGGIDVTNQITGGSVGELFTKRAANILGGADIVDYVKCHVKNTNGSDDAANCKAWVDNALISPAGTGTITAASTSASDGATKYLKLIYENAAGTYVTENLTLNGTSTVTSAGQMKLGTKCKIELRLVADDTKTTAAGDISINRGTLLGQIPTGYSSASGYIAMAVEGALDDTETTTNRLTAPGVVSFSVANNEANGIAFANSGTLTSGSAQGIWIRRTEPDGSLSSIDIDCCLRFYGEDS